MEPICKDKLTWGGNDYELDLYDDNDFSKLKPINQVYGFIFNEKGEFIIIKPKNGKWCLPGGTPEDYDKNWKETLIREVDEEANVDIKDIFPAGFIQSKALTHNSKVREGFLLRTVAKLSKIKKRKADPAKGSINQRKFISPDKFLTYCPWGIIGKAQLNIALREYKKLK